MPADVSVDLMSNNLGGSNRLLTLREAAELLNVSPDTLYNQWHNWGIPFFRPGNQPRSRLRVRERDLNNWIHARKAAA